MYFKMDCKIVGLFGDRVVVRQEGQIRLLDCYSFKGLNGLLDKDVVANCKIKEDGTVWIRGIDPASPQK